VQTSKITGMATKISRTILFSKSESRKNPFLRRAAALLREKNDGFILFIGSAEGRAFHQ